MINSGGMFECKPCIRLLKYFILLIHYNLTLQSTAFQIMLSDISLKVLFEKPSENQEDFDGQQIFRTRTGHIIFYLYL